jgi:hypothetical protein
VEILISIEAIKAVAQSYAEKYPKDLPQRYAVRLKYKSRI